ncbi:hypothetical protein AB0C18_24805 [Nonomuraea muscovyensis]|uniref:hypothetical protein n=1 Tax=Nonomuraea muscovyensis TaxID=1124761 RepID=UPI00340CCC5A
MGIPSGRFSIYRGTEPHAQSRLIFEYRTPTVNSSSHLVDTKWLCWGTVNANNNARFRAVDGTEEDDGWSCRLQIADAPYAGYWLDSSDGYVCAVGSSSQRWKFLGGGDHYEWWQGERPVVISDHKPASNVGSGQQLRAQLSATPQMYTINRIDR